VALENIQFFGEVDKANGRIRSDMPAYTFPRLMEDLNEDIDRAEREIARGIINDEKRAILTSKVNERKKRRDEILESVEEIKKTVSPDDLSKARKELGALITQSNFTMQQEHERMVDPYEEARRQTTPCIKVKDDVAEMAKGAGVKISADGKISRNDATRIWKMAGHVLNYISDGGEITNSMALKKQK
jgi:TusA-related sulfurtransferase